MYFREANGRKYEFTTDTHDLSGFTESTDANVHEDGFRTVATWDLEDGEGVAFGDGTSKNPDKAEAYIHLDAMDSSTTPVALNGQARLVVLNSAGEKVPGGTIYQNRLSRLRNGDPSTNDRGKWGVPFPYQAIRGGKGEVLGKGGYQIGIQLKLDSGSETFSLANSEMTAEGWTGTVQN